MPTRDELLKSIATTIEDYRQGEILAMTPKHVDTWVKQFGADVQEPVLAELDHVLDKVYCNRQDTNQVLSGLAKLEKLSGDDPAAFWRSAGLLNIQGGGASQREMLREFGNVLQAEFGFGINDCSPSADTFVYIDDGIFSGSRARNDLVRWVRSTAPQTVKLHVIVIALHRGGRWYINRSINEVAKEIGKRVDISWWRVVELEDRKRYVNNSDVLRPRVLPDESRTTAYVQMLNDAEWPPVVRGGNSIGPAKLFSSPEGRDLLEDQFLKAGLYIREICPNLPGVCRPLGFHRLKTLGFGSLVVTSRNCPNTCPLAFWVGAPWYPLFPRRTNSETEMARGWT